MSSNTLTLIIVVLLAWILALRKRYRYFQQACDTRTKEREAVLSFLHKIGERITHSIDLQGSLEIITNFIIEYTHAESGAIFLIQEQEKTLKAKVVIGFFPPLHETSDYVFTKRKSLTERIMRDRIRMGEGLIGYVAEKGESLLISEAMNDPRIPSTTLEFVPIETLMLCPLKIKEKALGVLALVNKRDGHYFNEEDMSLLQSLSDQAAVTVDMVKLYEELAVKQRIEQELGLARDFQSLLLPKQCPHVPGLDMAAFNEPALEVGGDYYDFFWVDENHLGIVIADVSGKGIPGALVMSMVRSVLRAESRNKLSPSAVLKVVNEYVRQDTKENVFITMTYVIMDIRKKTLRFARAGHEPLITFGKNREEPELYSPDGIALGLVEEDIFNITREKEINLANDDLVVLYTDGVVEAMNQASQEYGQSRLIDIVGKSRNGKAEGVIDAIMEDIKNFTQGIPQNDDITIIAFKVFTESGDSLHKISAAAISESHS
ncbi:SpoIIE family protein phosphatase [Candidatus Sumerlaeota bacterium]|nr:SpoIIE family protein phosphatase [Candidatus Sumerlaeota bacterium]